MLTSKIFVESKKQETRKEKEFSKKSVIDGEERVLKITAAIKQYENPFAFISTRKSKLRNIVTGSVAGSKHLNDILETRAIGKEHLHYFINEPFFEEKISF